MPISFAKKSRFLCYHKRIEYIETFRTELDYGTLLSIFGHTLKRDIDLLRFLYLQNALFPLKRSVKRWLWIAAPSKADTLSKRRFPCKTILTAFGCQTRLGVILIGTKRDYKRLSRQLLEANPFFICWKLFLLQNEINLIHLPLIITPNQPFANESMRCKNCLLHWDFSCKSKGTVRLVGSEARIRYFMMVFFGEHLLVCIGPLLVFPRKMRNHRSRLLPKQPDSLNPIELKMTTYILAVTILRFCKGNGFRQKQWRSNRP